MTLDDIFDDEGVLAQAMPGYRARQQQKDMALAVQKVIRQKKILIAEAGTGTGKTFAYLVPVLLEGGKAIISTGTKTLQDQLFNRDIQQIRTLLGRPVSVALLKGRANYLCHYYLERTATQGRFTHREDITHLVQIQRYAKITKSGDKAELSTVSEEASIWNQVTSSRDNCLGQECPFHQECFVLKARKAAQEADIVVVNHHLFFADVGLKDEGNGELLPQCNTVIFDEAHQLPEVASTFFGNNLTSGQLIELVRDSKIESLINAKDFTALPTASDVLEKAVREMRLVFKAEQVRLPSHLLQDNRPFQAALAELSDALAQLSLLLKAQEERSEGLKNLARRAAELLGILNGWGHLQEDYVHWLEVGTHHFVFNATPLNIAELFQKQIGEQRRAWVFVSATLAVDGVFTHYQNELGLHEAHTASWDSPFDYKSQAVLYVPKAMPQVSAPEFTRAVITEALPLLQMTQGHAFLLFTSLKAMREGYDILCKALDQLGLTYPVLMQGQASRTQLLEKFREQKHAILVASQTFWEGIDVKGEQLSLVVIDKLPFSPPDDPILSARIERIARMGGNAFVDYQLPRAVINLKQGAGRLIRDESDRGILMIADTRLVEKGYGKQIWRSLPAMRRTREKAIVSQFWSQSTLLQSHKHASKKH